MKDWLIAMDRSIAMDWLIAIDRLIEIAIDRSVKIAIDYRNCIQLDVGSTRSIEIDQFYVENNQSVATQLFNWLSHLWLWLWLWYRDVAIHIGKPS